MTGPIPEVSILIPAFNEEAHIASVVSGTLAALDTQGIIFETIRLWWSLR